ncbi:hypothetical protein OH76DRAFT_1413166, partial [Lentinus brumalis]
MSRHARRRSPNYPDRSHPGRGYVRRACAVPDPVDVAGSFLRGHRQSHLPQAPESPRPQNRGPSSPPCTQRALLVHEVCVLNMVATGLGLTRRLDRLPSDGHACPMRDAGRAMSPPRSAVVRIRRCLNAGRRAVPSHEQTARLRQQQSSRRTNYVCFTDWTRRRIALLSAPGLMCTKWSCSPGFSPAAIAGLPDVSSDERRYGRLELL